jgi:hypothetical protein
MLDVTAVVAFLAWLRDVKRIEPTTQLLIHSDVRALVREFNSRPLQGGTQR